MAYKHDNNSDWGNLGAWIPAIVCLMIPWLWPIGLVLLFRRLTGSAGFWKSRGQQRGRASQRDGSYDPYATPWQEGGQEWSASGSAAGTEEAAAPEAGPRAKGDAYDYSYTYRGRDYEYHYRYGGRKKGGKTGAAQQAPGMQGVPNQPPQRQVDLGKGKRMTAWGTILAIFGGIISFNAFFSELGGGVLNLLQNVSFPLGILGAGLVLLFCGAQSGKKAKRFRKYLALIGKRENISITSLAQAMPTTAHAACADLQEMLDSGILPDGYLDMGSGRLILNGDGIADEREPVPEPPQEEEKPQDDDAILADIRRANDAIADVEMSRKIDRIEEITGKILVYQRQNPDRAGQLRSFLNYYLPTTLKILSAYAQMEAQGVEGENIRSAKARIEGMMDKVVEGFEKQLDKLFADSAMDITTDVEVLERMLDKDGLSEGGLTMGG